MKKMSVFIILALLLCAQCPSEASFFAEQKQKFEQTRFKKAENAEIKDVFSKMTKYANKHDLDGVKSLFAKDFTNSDGFNLDTYVDMIKETWATYPDISYSTQIYYVDFSDNYARVVTTESAVAISKEQIGLIEAIGELNSVSMCIYTLEKHGTKWLVSSEHVIDETSTLKYGGARYMNIVLDTPKQIGANKQYTVTLKADIPKGCNAIASIGTEKIIYPQTKAEDNFRRITNESGLERVFTSNGDNVNEYAVASVGLAQIPAENARFDMSKNGLAFIITRVNVIPKNKFIEMKDESKK